MPDIRRLIIDCRLRQPAIVGLDISTADWQGDIMPYLHWNAAAAVHEIMEVLDCVDWKKWSSGYGRVHKPPEGIAEEGVDVLLFLGNMLAALGVTDNDLAAAYDRKIQLVHERAKNGYTARDANSD